jgi:hypothetical protein
MFKLFLQAFQFTCLNEKSIEKEGKEEETTEKPETMNSVQVTTVTSLVTTVTPWL